MLNNPVDQLQASRGSLQDGNDDRLSAEIDNTIPANLQPLEETDELLGAAIGDGRVFVGPEASPPFPEGIVADQNRIYVAGPAA
jgi:hypothetical protein